MYMTRKKKVQMEQPFEKKSFHLDWNWIVALGYMNRSIFNYYKTGSIYSRMYGLDWLKIKKKLDKSYKTYVESTSWTQQTHMCWHIGLSLRGFSQFKKASPFPQFHIRNWKIIVKSTRILWVATIHINIHILSNVQISRKFPLHFVWSWMLFLYR